MADFMRHSIIISCLCASNIAQTGTKFDSVTFNFAWWDEVLKDIRVIGAKNWTKVVLDRPAWHGMMEMSKPVEGCRT
jgi:hypothetical protein